MEYLVIGTIRKPHGVKGQLRIETEERYTHSLLQADVVFVHLKGNYVPYFVESCTNDGMILLKLEEIDSREAAKKLNGLKLSLRQTDIQKVAPQAIDPAENSSALIDFTIEDQTLGILGKIEEIIELPMQMLASIKVEGNEVLIPLHEDLILEIIPDQQLIRMDLPEGLLNLSE